jgi:hypothetical protein
MTSRKLQQISENIGLQADYGGGDYTVTVWDDMEGGYSLVFCRRNTDLAHKREHANADELEATMRHWQRDLRKWRKVNYDNE